MSRLARAIEIREAIDEFYKEGRGQGVTRSVALWSDAQILENEVGIADAIADCLGQEDK